MQSGDQSPGVEPSEDCLNLNVYVPGNVSESVKKPVMVWIFGGGFTSGSAHFYDSKPLALHGGVIVVTIQYRLGIFGFFSLGTSEALGNYGLWDQMLALEWVHQNIDSFGGDPASVTIFGESAGGASVSLLSLIPRNKDRFHRVIAQSGTMTAPWALTNPTEASFAIGEAIGCSRDLGTVAFVRCMRNMNSTTLLEKYYEYIYKDPTVFPYTIDFGPVLDGDLFKMAPERLLKNRSSEEYEFFSSLDFMTGTMKADGNEILLLTEDLQNKYNFNLSAGISSEEFCDIFVHSFTPVFFKNNSFISRKLCDEYQVINNISEQSRQMLDMHTEYFFAYPAFVSLQSHSQDNVHSNTFHYVFEYDGVSLMLPSPPSWYIGPGHADELSYLFPFFPLSQQQDSVSSVMMTYWTNFAKHGDPNGPSLADWPVYDNQREAYMLIKSNQSANMKYKKHRMEFWQRDIPHLIEVAPTGTVTMATKLGLVTGNINYLDNDYNKKVLTFYNIPFAKPPVGDLRFVKPEPYGRWTGTLNATVFGNQCMQLMDPNYPPGVETSEDCLNLNIYVPGDVSTSVKKPVMVWIYGGGFTIGSAHLYDSKALAQRGDVIVVTIQYRLGIFGFLSLGTSEALGNYGLWDQMLALEWVHQNIDSFGGDPASVTIFGESAGGASVSLLSLIPRNKDRFHRVIAQSGTMTAPWALTNPTEASFAIGELTGCPKNQSVPAFVRCLRNANANTLLNNYLGYVYRDPYAFPFVATVMGPVVDGDLFKMAPGILLKNYSCEEYQFFASLDYMTGILKSDGSFIALAMNEVFQKHYGFNLTTGISSDEFCDIIVNAFTRYLFRNNSFISRKICNEYQVNGNVSEQSRQMVDLFTDFLFAYPAFESLHHHSQDNFQSNTFHYVFELNAPSVINVLPPAWYIGPGHTDELSYFFPLSPLSSEQQKVSSAMMAYWTNFAYNGDPNDRSHTRWPPYDNEKEIYMAINYNLSAEVKYKERRMEFWQRDIPYLEESAPTGTITIPTKLGLITGNMNYLNNDYRKKVLTFYNIPFAKPPVGDLRFAKPEPYGRWTGTLNATVFGNQCMQIVYPNYPPGVETSEDCLNLNIYVPGDVSTSVKKPVMVWIFGGGFTIGSAHFYDSRALAQRGNVIVVTIQYRLGIFGFLSLGTSEAQGNYGIWDQMLALEWVHQNIDSFGGDPASVTIFGESAGGASVSLLSLIPRNKDRFHRVIAQSGTMTAPWALTNPTEASFAIGELTGCPKNQSVPAFARCLRNVNANTLLNNYLGYANRDPYAFPFVITEIGPAVDGDLFKMTPELLLKNYSCEEYQFFASLDYMTGTLKSDGDLIPLAMNEVLQKHYGFNLTTGISSDEFCDIIVNAFTRDFFRNNSFISRKICSEYQVKDNVSEQSRQMVDLFTDFLFAYPAFESLHHHSQDNFQSNTFHYVFELNGPSFMNAPLPAWHIGPGHADELSYFFPFSPLSSEQQKVSSVMTAYWTNFAYNGDPNDRSHTRWPPYDNEKEIYMAINYNLSTEVKYRERRMEFWQRDILYLEESAPTGTITIPTKLGLITGNINYLNNDYRKKVLTFYNIPFAKPPVGDLRFAKPEPYGRWTGTLNATVWGNQCMQPVDPNYPPGVETSEDCLNLNIYVPGDVSTSVKKPVMVWIYGGGFISGSSHFYESRALALQGSVIVVTIQYRLGIFGFFSLGTSDALGNCGLWDQMIALEWVHQNIDSFGGDPASVTIFGESAGGASVSLLSLIPRNKDRFHRVIAQSGTMTAPWALTNATEASFAIGELTGCPKNQSVSAFVHCLRNANANTLLNNYLGFVYRDPYVFPYVVEIGPVVDGDLFKMTPEILLKNYSCEEYKFFASLDYMTGTLKSDGSLIPVAMNEVFQKHYGFNLTTGISSDEFCDIIVNAFTRDFFKNNSFISKKICSEYQVKGNVSEQSRQMVDLFTDFLFAYPAFESLHHHSQDNFQSNTFHYVFELNGPSLMYALPPAWYIGPGHADELSYFFPFSPLSSEQQKVSSIMMAYWTNFVYNGDPNGPSLTPWEEYDNQKRAHLIIDTNQSTALRYKEQRMYFWERDIPLLMRPAPAETVTIPTRLGVVTGKINYVDNDYSKKVLTFYNIPFAKPPVGDLRFRKPVPHGGWTGTLNATAFGNQCMQAVNPNYQLPGVVPSEDCLILNIYVPNNVSMSAKKSVLVWVHGGGFRSDSAHIYDSRHLALQGDVIVVTIQYRLGIFGFLSLGTSEALGNYGIWDQMLALEWVHQNIDSFGGDPTSVTIFGESAGGASVSLLSLIPRNRNRFHRVIAQSGVLTAPWAMSNVTGASHAIGEMSGCSKTLQTAAFVRCLQSLSPTTLLNNFLRYTYRNPTAFPSVAENGPVIDGELFRLSPGSLLKNYSSEEYQFFSSLDFMTGSVRADGNIVLVAISEFFQKNNGVNLTTGISSDEFCTVFALPFTSVYFKNNSLIYETICEKYQIKNNISQQSRQMIDMYTDFLFAYPAFESLRLHSHDNIQSNTFHYAFELNLESTLPVSPPPWYIGPGHGDDLVCLFPFTPLSAQKEHVCSTMRHYWINFAKTGNPNDPLLPFWPTFDTNKQAYLLFDDNPTVQMKYEEDRMKLWIDDIPRITESTSVSGTVVQTLVGKIRGIERVLPEKPNNRVFVFYNIPFAKSPVGDLRFAKPVSYGRFNSMYNATTLGSACLQPPVYTDIEKYSEDCLQLNIYVPHNISTSNKRSVMVWIHGGGYALGSAVQNDGSILATKGNVIVVTVNYRLGVFGFFSLNDSTSKGNYGLWDQILALQWVKNNIASFGGNPNSITIFGESAGGFSVSLLSLIPQNQGLFHRVIAQSGTALAPIALGDSRPGTIEIGKLSQCEHNSDSVKFISCMRNISAEDLSKHYLTFVLRNPKKLAPSIDFMPGIDNELFRKTPSDIFKNTSSQEFNFFSSLDLISGVMKEEGSVLFDYITPDIQTHYNFNLSVGIPTEFVCNFYIPAVIDFVHLPGNQQLIKSAACDEYKDIRSQAHQARQTLNFIADLLFTVPMVNVLDAHSSKNLHARTFQYLVTQDYPYPYYAYPSWFKGPAHGDDVGFIFQFYTPPKDGLQEYLAVSDEMISYWSNFAKNGDPNDNSMVRWPAYNSESRSYIILDTGTKPELRYADSRVKFWTEDLPDRLTQKPTTTPETFIRDNSAKGIQQGGLVLFILVQCLRTLIL
ncbi:uncharacterized protein LOC125666537 isoform X2 [Ostrea edulis]|uniref:uncharacterized protein LOC125666537 isoform X2 n=1 Tax=Ostrea edulis TaxID=37623 RepID=UPI0024AEE7AA|nr:uncharacterized protein LOC125666537 isoform X2 [Ostrea edulis]